LGSKTPDKQTCKTRCESVNHRHSTILKNAKTKKNTHIDILILIATEDEEKAIKNIESGWKDVVLQNGISYYKKRIKGLNIALVRAHEKGESALGIIGQAAISELRPKSIAMVGFCAGKEGEVDLGDIIVPTKVYRYDVGKRISKTKLLPEIEALSLDPPWILKVERFDDNWRKKYKIPTPISITKQTKLFVAGISKHLETIIKPSDIGNVKKIPNMELLIKLDEEKGFIKFDAGMIKITTKGKNHYKKIMALSSWDKDEKKLKTRTGVLATGRNVQQWSEIFLNLRTEYDRKTIALDMEAFAVAMLAKCNKKIPWIIAKGVGDFANDGKSFDNRYASFACQSSFYFVIEFLYKTHFKGS